MADELPSPTPEIGSDDKTAADALGDERSSKPEKKLKPTHLRKGKKPRMTAREIVECGSAPFVLWMWAEIVRCHDILVLCILAAAITVLQAAPCHFVYELTKKTRLAVRLSFAAWFALTGLTWGVVYKNSQALSAAPSQAPVVIIPQPDFIEGTPLTRTQLEHIFPFGYAIIYLKDGKRDIHEFKNDKMNWKIDWDNVKVIPDFNAGTVTFSIPPISADGYRKMLFVNAVMNTTIPFKTGAGGMLAFFFGNNPVPFVAVLGDNQNSPVFAIGFRIPTPGEIPAQPGRK